MAVPVLSKDFYLCVCVWHIHSLVWNILIRVDVALFSCHSRGRTFDFYFPFLQTAYMCYDLQINQIRVTSPRTESRRKPRTLWRHYFGHGGASVKRVSAPLAAPGRLAACCIANTVQYKQRRRGGKKRLSNTSQHSFGPSSPRSKPTYQVLLEACRTTLRIEKQHGRRRAPNRGRKWRDCGRKSMKPCKEFDYTRRRKVCNMSPCKLFFFYGSPELLCTFRRVAQLQRANTRMNCFSFFPFSHPLYRLTMTGQVTVWNSSAIQHTMPGICNVSSFRMESSWTGTS